MRDNKGITLIALIITIIIILVLAAVTIRSLSGDNGIIKKSDDAGKIYNEKKRWRDWT